MIVPPATNKELQDLGAAMQEVLIELGPAAPDGTLPAVELQPLLEGDRMGWKLRVGETRSLFHGELAAALRCLADGLRQNTVVR